MPFTGSENVSVWSKVIPQERVETTLRPSASPPLSRPPSPPSLASHRSPGWQEQQLGAVGPSELRVFPPGGSLCCHQSFCFPASLLGYSSPGCGLPQCSYWEQ